MDDLLQEFVSETNESLDVVDVELVRVEHDPNNASKRWRTPPKR